MAATDVNGHRFLPIYGHPVSPLADTSSPHWWPSVLPSALKLGELVRAEPYVDVKEVPRPTGLSQLWVRLKPKASKASSSR